MSIICVSTFNNTTSKVFWITGTQMAVPERTLATLKEEGIDKLEGLFEFSKGDIDPVFECLCKPPGKVVNDKVVAMDPHVILAKSRKRVVVTAEETQYYAQVGRDITGP